MEIIQRKDDSPIAALRSTFFRQMIAMAVVPFTLIATNLQDAEKVFTSILFWYYIGFCITVILFARYNYLIVKRMQIMDNMVKSNLEKQIDLLERRASLETIGLRVFLLFFIVLIEVLPYFQHYRMLDRWHTRPILLRSLSYAGLALFQYIINRKLKERRVGHHLKYLKDIVSQMQ